MKASVLALFFVPLGLLPACGGDDGGGEKLPPGPCDPSGGTGSVTLDLPKGDAINVVVSDKTGAFVSKAGPFAGNDSATVDAPSCGMITVHATMGTNAEITTWRDVQPGDHLWDPNHRDPTTPHTLHVTVPTAAGATSVVVNVVCKGDSVSSFSTGAGDRDITTTCAADATSFTIAAYATLPAGSQIVPPQTASFASSGTTAVTLGAFQAPANTVPVTFTGAAGLGMPSLTVVTFAIADDTALLTDNVRLMNAPDPATVTAAAASGAGLEELVLFDTLPTGQRFRVDGHGYSSPGAVSASLADFLPAPSAIVAAGTDPARPTITWTADGAPEGVMTIVELQVGNAAWTVLGSALPDAWTLPALPAELAVSGDAALENITIYDEDRFASWDDIRTHLKDLFTVASASTHLRESTFAPTTP